MKIPSTIAVALILAAGLTAAPARAAPTDCVGNGATVATGGCTASAGKRQASRRHRRALGGKGHIATPATGPVTVAPTR